MRLDLVIEGGKVHTASESYRADIGIKGEKIVAIGKGLARGHHKGARVIDARGKDVLPGAIDGHVHLKLPFCGTVSADDFTTGTKAAARGGVTTIIDYGMQDISTTDRKGRPKKGSLWRGLAARKAEADGNVCVDYSLHGAFLKWDISMADEIAECVSKGVPDFKMFMIYESEGWQSDDGALFEALGETRKHGAMIMVHAESERVMNRLIARYSDPKLMRKYGAYCHCLSRPNFVEAEAIQRAVTWADVSGGKLFIVHMSTGEGADIVRDAIERGVDVYAETCPQYLLLTDELFKSRKTGHYWATCPQLKKKADNRRLWDGIAEGEVSLIGTDTCTFTTKQKAMWKNDFRKIPFGMPGIETMLPAMYTHGYKKGRISINRLVEVVSTNPARIYGMYPRKGTIRIGADADIAIIDPRRSKKVNWRELATNCDWNPFQGETLFGFPDITLSRGTIVTEGGKFVGKVGHGRFVERKPGGGL